MFKLIQHAAKVIAVRKVLEAALPAPIKPTNGATVLTPTGIRHLLSSNGWTVRIECAAPVRLDYQRVAVIRNRLGIVISRGAGVGETESAAELNAVRVALNPLIKWTE